MAFSFPRNLPVDGSIAQIELRAINAVAYSASPFTFSGQTHEYAGKMWQADVTLKPMRRSDAEKWIAWLISLRGQVGTFYLGDPLGCTPMGSARDSDGVLVNGATSSGTTIDIDGAPVSTASYLKAGDYMQIGDDVNRQLFKVLDDVDTDASGQATVQIWPNVRTSIADNAEVTFESAKGIFRLNSNEQAWSVNNMAVYGLTFGAMEAL